MNEKVPTNSVEGSERADEEVMESLRSGDETALATLIDRHGRGLRRYVRGMLASPDDAEDVVQETFLRVWTERKRWMSGGSPQAYVYRIARNLALMRLRHMEVRARADAEIRERGRPARSPLDDASLSELLDALNTALAALPARRREAYLLVRVQQLTLDEAAEVMDLTKRTVSNHVYMALSDLERMLRPHLDKRDDKED